jgi:hypothetical protein
MEIDTTEYEFSHGVRPRGEGMWWFLIYWPSGRAERFSFNAVYTTALNAAKKYGRGAWKIEVLS